ncbi:6-phosphofructokinase [Phaffia rhodozyma]|uniref:ATP-dependent 6-phosphofructokinase n=1 Tax=Phaffia rhodozyma TaxID=264483 RepID=A0A0F7SET5_PHARH|nr:6-phosphofructokinase [Phaffia rhodozyma]
MSIEPPKFFSATEDDAPPRKLAVLTSGGDSAGMNAAVRSVVRMGLQSGCHTYVVREGWEGLVRGNSHVNKTVPSTPTTDVSPSTIPLPMAANQDPLASTLKPKGFMDQPLTFGSGELLKYQVYDSLEDEDEANESPDAGHHGGKYIIRVGWDDVRGWLGEGGTLIGTARSAAFRTPEGRQLAALHLIEQGIDCLVVCGGDGSLTGADFLRKEWTGIVKILLEQGKISEVQAKTHNHLNIVGLVGSIDNDMAMTDLTIGGLTALHRICEAIDSISSTASSHSRAFVVEVMGRHCGWLALLAGVSTGADYILIPEKPPASDDWESEMCHVLQGHRSLGKRKSIVIVAEGALDRNLQPIKAAHIKDVLTDRLGLDTRVTTLGHTQRGGVPCAFDRILATLQGVEAVNAVLEANPETPSYVIGIVQNKIVRNPLEKAVQLTQAVAEAIENRDFDKAMSLRDAEFGDTLEAFIASATSTHDHSFRLPKSERMRVGIVHVGAPAGGMNAATRQAVRYCLSRGHTPVAIYNGFAGLLDGNVSELDWLRVDGWATRGGSELGTNRTLPDVDLGHVATAFQQYEFDSLMLIGGFEAFNALHILEQARKSYPSFHIPMVHLPATISNNVPLTEFSLGSDTSLNALVEACDAIKQSASASRNRVFVVETAGGNCGYIAAMGALAVGALCVYTPEVGVSLDLLRTDVRFLRKRYELDTKGKSEGRLIIRNEKSSSVYNTELITDILKEEGGALFDARSASLGHTLQGGIPSPLDRARAVRLSTRCIQFLEKHHLARKTKTGLHKARHDEPSPEYVNESAAVITIQGSKIIFAPVEDVLKETDMKKRRGKHPWWADIRALVELMGGRKGMAEGYHHDELNL